MKLTQFQPHSGDISLSVFIFLRKLNIHIAKHPKHKGKHP